MVRVEPDELVNAADIARRTSRSRASVSHLVEGRRGPGNFPSPRASVGQRPVWDWLDVANWFASNYRTATEDVRSAAFLSAMNGALCIRRVAPHLKGDEERRALAKLIEEDAALLGLGRRRDRSEPT
ncbi:MAG TPA: hypothetical protein VFX49_06105, partial [Chloroflexota bacterium]|nr:hypothetical protein [Chloroflexota bacterium]